MNILIGTIVITALAIALWWRLPNAEWRNAAYQATIQTLAFTLPRILVALLGAGFVAELLPTEHVQALFGKQSGMFGILLAAIMGPITPGGAFVSFAIGAAALKAGAATAQVLTYVTAWALFSLTKILAYELPFLGRQTALIRIAICLPVPFYLGFAAQLLS